jgi:hypothetical protein
MQSGAPGVGHCTSLQQTPTKQLPPQQTSPVLQGLLASQATQMPPVLQTGVGLSQSSSSQQSRQMPLPWTTQQFGVGSAHPAVLPVQQSALAMQRLPHGLKPAAHWHCPPEQTALSGHSRPHAPQLSGSVWRFSQVAPVPVPQQTSGAKHSAPLPQRQLKLSQILPVLPQSLA